MADRQFQFIDKNSNPAPAVTWSGDGETITDGNSTSAYSSLTLVRLYSSDDVKVYIEDPSDPKTNGTTLVGGVPEHVFVPKGYQIRVSGGDLEITEC